MNRLLCRDKIYAHCSAVAAAEATFPSLPPGEEAEGGNREGVAKSKRGVDVADEREKRFKKLQESVAARYDWHTGLKYTLQPRLKTRNSILSEWRWSEWVANAIKECTRTHAPEFENASISSHEEDKEGKRAAVANEGGNFVIRVSEWRSLHFQSGLRSVVYPAIHSDQIDLSATVVSASTFKE